MAADLPTDGQPEPHPDWSRRAQDIAAILWPSFLAAAAATMFFFALIDPLDLVQLAFPGWSVGRMSGYAIGFFFFWAFAAISSLLTIFLVRTKVPDPPRKQ